MLTSQSLFPQSRKPHRVDLSKFESDELFRHRSGTCHAMWQLCAASDLLLSTATVVHTTLAACLIARGERGPKHTSHGTQVHIASVPR